MPVPTSLVRDESTLTGKYVTRYSIGRQDLDVAGRELESRIRARSARVSGICRDSAMWVWPLAVEFARVGYAVTGIDVQPLKTAAMNRCVLIQDVAESEVAPLVSEGRLQATTDFAAVRDLDTINICVPTPLRKTKDPDMSCIVSACEQIAPYMHPGMLVVLELTTDPGTTGGTRPSHSRKHRTARRHGFLPVFFARASRSGTHGSTLVTSPKWSAAPHRTARKWQCF